MEPKASRTLLKSILLLVILIGSIISVSSGFIGSYTIASLGVVSYPPEIFVTVDFSRMIAINNLSLGYNLDYEWKIWLENDKYWQLSENANFKLIRFFDSDIDGVSKTTLMPCLYCMHACNAIRTPMMSIPVFLYFNSISYNLPLYHRFARRSFPLNHHSCPSDFYHCPP